MKAYHFVIISSLYSRVDGRQCAENPSVNATLLNIFEMTKLEGIENVVVWAWRIKGPVLPWEFDLK